MDGMIRNRKVVVRDDFSFLSTFIQGIPESFATSGEVIYRGRNEVRKIDCGDLTLVVKSFKKPNIINRFAYTYVRSSKAERSYYNSLYLLSHGIDSPMPVAFVNCYEKGLVKESYYVSSYTECKSLGSIVNQDISETTPVIRAFAEFAFDLHKKGIYHKDFNVSNVLFSRNENGFLFSLIDNNRMSFGSYSMEKAMSNLRRLTLGADYFGVIAKAYAKASNEDELVILKKLSLSRVAFMKRIRRKQRLKRILRGNLR